MDYKAAAELLKKQDRILILTHRRPDGDTIGCAAGLCAALREQGKTACILPNEDATSLFTPYLGGYLAEEDWEPDFVVSVDIAGRSLFTPRGERYLARGIDLGIDHHPSYEGFARESCVDPGRAACGELIYDLIRQWGPVSPAAALPLYVAVATDTGCFMYSNTTPATHRVCADLMAVGIDFQGVNKRHFRTKSLKRLRLESLLVDGMDVHDGGATVIAAISLADMARLEARKLTLGTKQEMVERAFQRALEKLTSLPDAEYVSLLANLAAAGSRSGHEAVIFSQKDRARFGKQVVTLANDILARKVAPKLPEELTGSKAGAILDKVVAGASAVLAGTGMLTLAEESRPMAGGLILRDNNVETNCSFEVLIHLQRDALAAEVAKTLFD